MGYNKKNANCINHVDCEEFTKDPINIINCKTNIIKNGTRLIFKENILKMHNMKIHNTTF